MYRQRVWDETFLTTISLKNWAPKRTQNFEYCFRDLWTPQNFTLIAPKYEFLAFFMQHVNIQRIKG